MIKFFSNIWDKLDIYRIPNRYDFDFSKYKILGVLYGFALLAGASLIVFIILLLFGAIKL